MVREERAAEDELGAAGDLRVEAHGGPDVPGGHLAEVVVAGDAVGGVRPDGVEHLADGFLGLPGLAGKSIEPRGFDRGLVVELGVEAAGFGDGQAAVGVVEEARRAAGLPCRCRPCMVEEAGDVEGTIQRYCAALPSTKSSSCELRGSNLGQVPSALRFWM